MEKPINALTKIQIQLRNGPNKQYLSMDFDEKDTIGSMKERLSKKTGINSNIMKIIFCGRQLSESTNLSSLFLGPQTNLIVNIDHNKSATTNQEIAPLSSKNVSEIDKEAYVHASFHVFCKKCNKLERGKLRAYCNCCDSTSIIFKNEPQGWSDVLGRNKLKVDCNECENEQNSKILFKCVNCEEVSMPLTHIKQNLMKNECVICGEISHLILIMDCKHSCCVECFIAYSEQLISQMNLSWKPSIGYTISCPIFECPSYLTDVHHFYLLGMEAYQRFQRLTAQMFFAKQIERHYCPSNKCNAAFILEEIEENNDEEISSKKMILCPECSKLFCRYCKIQGVCKCEQELEKDISEMFIEKITKLCPNCNSPTERDGGCAHIHCTQCQAEWCFLCQDLWSNSCQSDHWFD